MTASYVTVGAISHLRDSFLMLLENVTEFFSDRVYASISLKWMHPPMKNVLVFEYIYLIWIKSQEEHL